MKILTIVSQKGGVGKTTLALNLGYALASAGNRVVLIDVDAQGAVGHSLSGAAQSAGLAGVLSGESGLEEALLRTRLSEFAILPSGVIPPQRAHDFGCELADGQRLGDLCQTLGGTSDLVILDTPSGFAGATLGAVRAADFAVTPLQAEPVALRTLPQLLELMGALRSDGYRVSLAAIVLCMLQQRNADSLAVAEEVWTRLPQDLVVETTVPRDATVLAASAAGVPLGLLSRLRPPPIALVFDQLAAELSVKLGLSREGEDGPIGLFA